MNPDCPSPGLLYASELMTELGTTFPETASSHTALLEDGAVLEVSVDVETSTIRLVSPLTQADQDVRDTLFRRLLEGNFLWQGSEGAVFGFDCGRPVLLRSVDARTHSYERFREVVEVFVNTAASWAVACAQAEEPEADQSGPLREASPFDMLSELEARRMGIWQIP